MRKTADATTSDPTLAGNCSTQSPGVIVRWAVRLLALVALGSAAYLAGVSLMVGDSALGCGGLPQFDCEHVLTSVWSRWLGMPVSVPAVGVYCAIVVAAFLLGPKASPGVSRGAWLVLMVTVTMAAGSALWFISLILFVVQKGCLYCFIVHGCGLTIAVLALPRVPVRRKRADRAGWRNAMQAALRVPSGATPAAASDPGTITPPTALGAAGLATVGVTLLIGGQILFPAKMYRIEEYDDLAQGGPGPQTIDPGTGLEGPDLVEPEGVPIQRPGTGENAPGSIGVPQVSRPQFAPVGPDPVEPTPPKPNPVGPIVLPGLPDPQVVSPTEPPGGTVVLPAEIDLPPPRNHRRNGRSLSILKGKVTLHTGEHPVLGDPVAPYIVVDLFDYTCKHCRKLSHQLEEARKRYGGQFAVLALPTPMSQKCNTFVRSTHSDHREACRYAKLALAVWEADPSRFAEYHHWVFRPDERPSFPDAKEYAAGLVGREALESEFNGPAVWQRIRNYTRLHQQSGGGSIPKLLYGKSVFTGETASVRQFFEVLEQLTTMKRPRR